MTQRRRTFFKEWRKHRNMTLEVAAERAGMTAGNLSQLERGTQGYSQTGLEALAEAYDCDPGQLISQSPVSDAPQADLPLTRRLLPTFIRQWRKHRGQTLAEVADLVNVSHATISRIETGSQPYSQPILEGIAGALRKTPDLSHAPRQALAAFEHERAQIQRRAVGENRPFAHSGRFRGHKSAE
jgi:transcriptional regulator with XRE-family HTH domain